MFKFKIELLIKIFIAFIFLASQFTADASSLYLSKYSNEDGLSQNSITCSLTDEQGFHWFSTQGGLNRFDGYDFKKYKFNSKSNSISGNWITDCVKDNNGKLWFSTTSNGINQLDIKTGKFTHFTKDTKLKIANNRVWSMTTDQKDNLWLGHEENKLTYLNLTTLSSEVFTLNLGQDKAVLFRDLIVDEQNNIWLASNQGLHLFDVTKKSFITIKSSPKSLWRLAIDQDNNIIVASKKGLSIFHKKQQTFSLIEQLSDFWITDILINPDNSMWLSTYGKGLLYKTAKQDFSQPLSSFKHSKENIHGLANDYLLSLYRDPKGIIWVGTDGYGLHRYDNRQQQFHHQNHVPEDTNSLSHSFVRAILKDNKGQLWVGTRNGLNKKVNNAFMHYKKDNQETHGLTNSNIFSLHEDKSGQIWVGTYGGGLFKYIPETNSFNSYTVESHQLSSNRIYVITSDSQGNIWLGSNNGISKFNPETHNIKHFQHNKKKKNSLSNNIVFSLLLSPSEEDIWIGTRNGLNKLSIKDEQFTHVYHEKERKNGLSHNMVTSLALDDENTLWVGTFQGLNKLFLPTGEVNHITEESGLLNNNIFAVKIANNQVWIATNQGLTRLNRQTLTMQHFLPVDGIQHNSFILGAAFKAADGELLFGGINGFNQFYPKSINTDYDAPTPVLTDLLLFNSPTKIAEHMLPKGNQLSTIDHVNHLQFEQYKHVIGFKYSAVATAASPKHFQFAYKLKGLDKQWLFSSSDQRQVNFSHLPAGNYALMLKAANQYGQWSDSKKMLNLTIVPPWWSSTLAYFFYALILLATISTILFFIYRAKISEQETLKQKELNQLKSQFLDNVSHELKTPLSLISTPLDGLLNKHSDPISQKQLNLIKRSSKQLLNYIEQLLQLSQRPSAAAVMVSPYPGAAILKQLTSDFEGLFKEKLINYKIKIDCPEDCYLQLEINHLTTIINNLLSNALKYTPAHGRVEISINHEQKYLVIKVKDSGCGIDNKMKSLIFERFTRIDNTSAEGSGIGLSLVKQLVAQYSGTISVESKLNQGSSFLLKLPYIVNGQRHEALNQSHNLHPNYTTPHEVTITASQHSKKAKLLIIEDNEDMRVLLLSLFADHYDCIVSNNGEQGLVLSGSHMPDIIISDVMMPKMDGYQFLQALRSDIAISHIPVLLLSAKADTNSKLKGLDLLADDYLAKPFEPNLLKSRVNALLAVRGIINQHLRQQLQNQNKNPIEQEVVIKGREFNFTQRLKEVMDEQYMQDTFTVEELANLLHMSPRALQLKMKALYDLTPNDYIRNTRLEYATSYLTNTELTIGAIAEKVGFGSQSYFSRCFKTQFSLTPKAYRDENK